MAKISHLKKIKINTCMSHQNLFKYELTVRSVTINLFVYELIGLKEDRSFLFSFLAWPNFLTSILKFTFAILFLFLFLLVQISVQPSASAPSMVG